MNILLYFIIIIMVSIGLGIYYAGQHRWPNDYRIGFILGMMISLISLIMATLLTLVQV